MEQQPTYRNITATVRPPRCAIFINKESEHWKSAASGAIMQASQVWGGRHFLLIPTDGVSIDDKFWEILEAYDPDHLAVYNLTVDDLKDSQPDEYLRLKQGQKQVWKDQGFTTDLDRLFVDHARRTRLDTFKVSEDLKRELILRLSPFHFRAQIYKRLSRSQGFGFPFTSIAKILPHAKKSVDEVILPRPVENAALALLAHSQSGIGGDDYRQQMSDQGFAVQRLAQNYNLTDFLKFLLGTSSMPASNSDDWVFKTPFALSMIHLGEYYRIDRHEEETEPVVVILGDTVDDFCLYYSLSRMHSGVQWLPLELLRDCNSAMNERRRRLERGEDVEELTDEQGVTLALVNLFYELIEYGHGSKRIQLSSMSLTKRQLVACKRQVAECSYFRHDYASSIDCVQSDSVSTKCVLRVFEENNHVNHRSMVFVDGRSVSPFDTPKPKNFEQIIPSGHYWLTSLTIEGYQPPSLPTLGPEILQMQRTTKESRVAKDGMTYLCPNSMYFGGDIDVVTVRPKIAMPDVMSLFNSYFEDIGVTVQYSDKGKYLLDTLQRFGGLEEVGKFIKAPTTRSILDKFMWNEEQTKREWSDETEANAKGSVVYLQNDQRAYLNLHAFTKSIGNQEDAATLVDELVGKEVLQRGYIFHCERCNLSSWYSIDVLTSEFTCNRCSFRQQFTRSHWKMPLAPHWYYKLAETIYQFRLHNSDLVVQVLYALKSQSTYAFHYMPELDLFGFPGSSKKREMDVACILDGQIIFGECKSGKAEPLRAKDVEKFEALVRQPIKNPSRIIFATKQDVSDSFKIRMSGLPNAEILTRNDLYDD